MHAKTWLIVASLLGAIGVILGAFGAHLLEARIDQWYAEADEQSRRLANWETAVRYQMYHALALAGVALLVLHRPSSLLTASGSAFALGVVLFSGSLYLLVLTGVTRWGAVTPFGGFSLIVGWILLAIAAARL